MCCFWLIDRKFDYFSNMHVRLVCVCVFLSVFEYGSARSNIPLCRCKSIHTGTRRPVSPLSGFQCHFATPHHTHPSWWPRKRWDSRGEPSGLVRGLEGSLGSLTQAWVKKKIYVTAVVKKKRHFWLVIFWFAVGWKVLESWREHVEFNDLLPLKPMRDLLHHFSDSMMNLFLSSNICFFFYLNKQMALEKLSSYF